MNNYLLPLAEAVAHLPEKTANLFKKSAERSFVRLIARRRRFFEKDDHFLPLPLHIELLSKLRLYALGSGKVFRFLKQKIFSLFKESQLLFGAISMKLGVSVFLKHPYHPPRTDEDKECEAPDCEG